MSFTILGPALGSFLFSAGGFVLPFEVVGSVGMQIVSVYFKHMLTLLRQNVTKFRVNYQFCLFLIIISKDW
jgi:hypothetical protein